MRWEQTHYFLSFHSCRAAVVGHSLCLTPVHPHPRLSVCPPLCIPQCPLLPSFFYQLPASQWLPFTLHVSGLQGGGFKYILFLFTITSLLRRRVTVVTVQTSITITKYRPSEEKGQCCRSLYSGKKLIPPKLFAVWNSVTSICVFCF